MSSKTSPAKSAPTALSPGDALGRELSTAVIAFHEAVAAQLGLRATEWKCLGVLGQHGPMTAGHLATLSGFTTGAITGIVDRLARAGYVRRKRSAQDRRSVIIEARRLDEVMKRIAPVFASLSRSMAALASGYTHQQLAAIHDYLAKTIHVLRDETASLAGKKK